MPLVQMDLSPDQLLKAVAQLAPDELELFVAQVVALQAQRRAPSLPHAEAELLLKINAGLSAELLQRYRDLIAKRDAGTLTPEEYAELLQLTSRVEEFEAQRAAYLVELSQLRQVSLQALMDTLDIRPSNNG